LIEHGEYQEALEFLRSKNPSETHLVRTRNRGLRPASLTVQLCDAQRHLGQLEDAETSCRKAMEEGSPVLARLKLAEVLAQRAQFDQIPPLTAAAIFAAKKTDADTSELYFLQALALAELNRRKEAVESASSGIHGWYFYRPAVLLLEELGKNKRVSAAAFLKLIDEHRIMKRAERLARCGHVYLDLQLPKRAAGCFSASERLLFGPALSERMHHASEESPEKGISLAKEAGLSAGTHSSVMLALAQLYHAIASDVQAMYWLRRALEAKPHDEEAESFLPEYCRRVSDSRCDVERERGANQVQDGVPSP
jgi:hypothetical protein